MALLLVRTGRVPDRALGHLDVRVLLFLLGQKPGHYAAHHETIARACESNATSVKRALGRLREAGLVVWELVPPHHALPSGRYTRTNVNRYAVNVSRLEALFARAAPASAPAVRAPRADSNASTRADSTSSYGTTNCVEQKPPPSTPPRRVERHASAPNGEREAVLNSIVQAWEKLGLGGSLDRRSRCALENRLDEGASVEMLEAAVEGAGLDEWLRRRAKVPFAVVFASVASVERFAHAGRKQRDARAAERRARDERSPRRSSPPATISSPSVSLPSVSEPAAGAPEIPLALPWTTALGATSTLTHEQFAHRRAEELARFVAWCEESAPARGECVM